MRIFNRQGIKEVSIERLGKALRMIVPVFGGIVASFNRLGDELTNCFFSPSRGRATR